MDLSDFGSYIDVEVEFIENRLLFQLKHGFSVQNPIGIQSLEVVFSA